MIRQQHLDTLPAGVDGLTACIAAYDGRAHRSAIRVTKQPLVRCVQLALAII